MQSFIGLPLGALIYVSAAYSPFLGLAACYIAAMALVSTIPSNSMQAPKLADAPKRAS
jgi:p-aminobenzoyl-glutamate transporter AbgT